MQTQLELKWQTQAGPPGDFITNMRYEESSDILLMIHQRPSIGIVRTASQIYFIAPDNTTSFEAESNIYDAVVVQNCMILSNRNMPVRLYTLPQQGEGQLSMNWISFNDKKPNSEQYLSPLSFCKYNDVIIGGGKKFMSQYDCVKNCVARRFKQMNKRFISAVELVHENLVVAGQFDGQLSFQDLKTEQNCITIKPHVDLVTRIKRAPGNDYHFVTLARKDNYTYLWDCRKIESFVSCYEQPLYGNQRTGLDISSDGKTLYLGDETGNLTARSLQTGTLTLQYLTNTKRCISSICSTNTSLIFASGEREFPYQQTKQRSGQVGCLLFS